MDTNKTLDFIKRAKLVHGDRYVYDYVEYINANTKVSIKCKTHGLFEQTPYRHLTASVGCPECAGNVKLTTKLFIEKAKAIHGDKYDYSEVCYKNIKTKVKIRCLKHGYYEQRPDCHLKGQGCGMCANNVRMTVSDFVEKANLVHGNFYVYNHVDYVNNKSYVYIECPIHGVFKQNASSHLRGYGCPSCGIEKMKSNKDYQEIKKVIRQSFIEKYGVDNPMHVDSIRRKHKKKVNDEKVREKASITKRENNSFNTSSIEDCVYKKLVDLYGKDDVIRQYKDDRYSYNCDFYIKSRDLWIEVNAHWTHGGHWYDSIEDSKLVSEWSSKSLFYKKAVDVFTKRDVMKRKSAEVAGLNYVVFWSNDISDFEKWLHKGCPDGSDWMKEYSWL